MAIIIYYLITYDFNTIALLYYFCNFATGNAIFSIHDRTVHRSLSCLLHAYILKNLKKKSTLIQNFHSTERCTETKINMFNH